MIATKNKVNNMIYVKFCFQRNNQLMSQLSRSNACRPYISTYNNIYPHIIMKVA